jgi:hypothetical protein
MALYDITVMLPADEGRARGKRGKWVTEVKGGWGERETEARRKTAVICHPKGSKEHEPSPLVSNGLTKNDKHQKILFHGAVQPSPLFSALSEG